MRDDANRCHGSGKDSKGKDKPDKQVERIKKMKPPGSKGPDWHGY